MNDLSLYRSVARQEWRARRAEMETTRKRYTRAGVLGRSGVLRLMPLVDPLVAALGLRRRALANALAIELHEIPVAIPRLPAAFDGYRILQLSDVHVGRIPGLVERAAGLVRTIEADLAVLNGDIQTRGTPAATVAAAELAPLLDAVRARDGIIGVLGNHDRHDLADQLEAKGVRMLINDDFVIERGSERIRITGVDDVNNFYTEAAERALRSPAGDTASIAVVHSPELADVAADAGYALYLTGHTHGGQICLPSGKPILTAVRHHRRLASGLWRYGRMLGYTSRGVGVARRARFNCPPEVTVLRLRRADPT